MEFIVLKVNKHPDKININEHCIIQMNNYKMQFKIDTIQMKLYTYIYINEKKILLRSC